MKQHFLPSFINSFSVIYVMSKILNKKIKINDYKLYITILIFIIYSIINFLYVNNMIRLASMTLIVFLGSYFLFQENIKRTLLCSILEQLIVVVSELISFFIIVIFTDYNISTIRNIYYGNKIFVIIISILMIIISNFSITKKIYFLFLKNIKFININNLTFYSIIIIISINFLIVGNFLEIGFLKLLITNIFFVIIYCIILYYAINKNNENVRFKLENKNLITNLNEYEKMLDYQRISNHENKNQLLVIKSMIEKHNEKTIEYIDEIIKEKREDNEIIYTKAKRIPSGGLQGLIYQKMLLMQENSIEVVLDVSTQVRKIDLNNISTKMNYDICRVIGIILDNAIEETNKFNKKDREIIISMYVDEYFFIEVSNRFKANIDINKINEKGYTTKEKGHGYGLSLLNKVVSENDKIYNEIRVVNNIFTQIVKIKM